MNQVDRPPEDSRVPLLDCLSARGRSAQTGWRGTRLRTCWRSPRGRGVCVCVCARGRTRAGGRREDLSSLHHANGSKPAGKVGGPRASRYRLDELGQWVRGASVRTGSRSADEA
jgi:hypothetical protein